MTEEENHEGAAKKELAAVFFALADQNRLQIIALLSQRSMNCSEIKDVLGVSLPTVTYHLDILIRVGIVEQFREGTWKYGVLQPRKIDEAFHKLQQLL